MTVLGAAHNPFFHGGSSGRGGDKGRVVDVFALEFLSNQLTVSIVTNDPRQRSAGAQPLQHVRHVCRAAQSMLPLVHTEQDYRSFLAHSLRVTPCVAVQDDVA